MVKTITEAGYLYLVQHREANPFKVAIRFCNARLRQLRKLERRVMRQALWLRLRQFLARHWSQITGHL